MSPSNEKTNHDFIKAKVLLVDDLPDNLSILEEILNDQNCSLIKTNSGQEALEKLREHEIALILLDIQMPVMNGFETAELIQSSDENRDIPIIFITAINKQIEHINKGYEIGAVDYLFKPINPVILQSKVKIFLQLYYQKKELEKLSKTDPLTGLSNRRYVNEKIEFEKKRFDRTKRTFSIILADIDNFKNINDTCGHDCGDYVLVNISKIFINIIRDHDIACRWGGDELLIFLPETEIESGRVIAERIREQIDPLKLKWKKEQINVTMSFGVSQYNNSTSITDCIRNADEGLYSAKKHGKNQVRIKKDDSTPIEQYPIRRINS